MDTILASLFATGVAKATGVGYSRAKSALQEPEISEELDPLTDKFHGLFEEKLRDIARQLDDMAIIGIADDWEDIATDLSDGTLEFEDNEEAVEFLVDEIYRHEYTDGIELNRAHVERAVSAAYAVTLEKFCDEVAENDELANRLNQHLGVQILERLDDLRQVAADIKDIIKPTERYDLYDPGQVDWAIRRLIASEEPDWVNRDEVDQASECEQLVITGPIGSGKTRVLAELLRRRAGDDRIKHVMLVDPENMKTQDQWAFEFEDFEGDVLLVWEDAGRAADDFENVVPALNSYVNSQGYDLHILAEVRAERIERFPSDTIRDPESIEISTLPLWEPFRVVELGKMPSRSLRELTRNFEDEHEVDVDQAAREKLVERLDDRSAPAYLRAVFRSAGDSLTLQDVENLPDSAIGIWQEAYNGLRSEDQTRNELIVIRACRLLYDMDLQYYAPLVRGVYEHVLDGVTDNDGFYSAIETLENWGWIDITREDRNGTRDKYRLHDTQVEAVTFSLHNRMNELSDYILEEGVDDARGRFDRPEIVLNRQFANAVNDINSKIAKKHYEANLEVDTDNWITHNNYANLLQNLDDREEDAEKHYRRALVLSSTDDPLGSNFPVAYYNYARFVETKSNLLKAKKHSE